MEISNEKRATLWDEKLPYFRYQVVAFNESLYQLYVYSVDDEEHPERNGVVREPCAVPGFEMYKRGDVAHTVEEAYSLAADTLEYVEDMFDVSTSGKAFDVHKSDASVLDDLSIHPSTAFVLVEGEYDFILGYIAGQTQIDTQAYKDEIHAYRELINYGYQSEPTVDKRSITQLKRELSALLEQRKGEARAESETLGFWDYVKHKRTLLRGLDRGWMDTSLYLSFLTTTPTVFHVYHSELQALAEKSSKSFFPNKYVEGAFNACDSYALTYVKDEWRYRFPASSKGNMVSVNRSDLLVLDFGMQRLDLG